jgi:16S rRNA (guanine527-N7)-methyltransferase
VRVALEQLLQALAADPHAPTSARDPATAVDTHIADSLSALALERVRAARTIADLGAGAGFPGLALAAALPGARVRLIESVQRKATFIAAAAQAAKLDNADAVATRAEDWAAGIGANDVVTARALAPLAVICEYAAPLLARDGALVAWKGIRSASEEARAHAAAAELGLEPVAVQPVRPYEGARDHHLHVYLKVRDTPDRFPRRAGIARKRPLGG